MENLEYKENAKLDLRAAVEKINELIDAYNNLECEKHSKRMTALETAEMICNRCSSRVEK